MAVHQLADSDPVLRVRCHHVDTGEARDEAGFDFRPVS